MWKLITLLVHIDHDPVLGSTIREERTETEFDTDFSAAKMWITLSGLPERCKQAFIQDMDEDSNGDVLAYRVTRSDPNGPYEFLPMIFNEHILDKLSGNPKDDGHINRLKLRAKAKGRSDFMDEFIGQIGPTSSFP